MRYEINAWLERREPSFKIIDKSNDSTVLSVTGDALHYLFEQGELCLSELLHTPSQAWVEQLIQGALATPSGCHR